MRTRPVLCALFALAVLLAGCGGDEESRPPEGSGARDGESDSAASSRTSVDEQETTTTGGTCVDSIPIDVAIGQIPLLLVSPGTDISGFDGSIGGIVLVEAHTADSVAALRGQLDAFTVPGILASDEEGGRVQRVRSVLGDLPSAQRVATMVPDEAARLYADYSAGLAGLGIDMNLAPVVDVGSAALGDRSYSSDPALVTAASTLFIDAMIDAGVFPVIKHFPGLGLATGNTDHVEATGPPLSELRERDLLPYLALAERDDEIGVMIGHVAVPDVTGDVPASLSPEMYDVLRDEVGFDGITVTDSLTAGATVGDLGGAVVRSVASGADMTAFSGNANVAVAVDALTTAVGDGRIPEARVRDAAATVLAVKGIDPCSVSG